VVLFTKGKSVEFLERLTRFSFDFERDFGMALEHWNGDITGFTPAKMLIKRNFIRDQ